jgi:hypothetical protein
MGVLSASRRPVARLQDQLAQRDLMELKNHSHIISHVLPLIRSGTSRVYRTGAMMGQAALALGVSLVE